MKSPFCFLVNPVNNQRYDNVKKISDVEFIISSTKEDHTISNRFAKVISNPINYKGPIKPGDILLVHHNVFKLFYDMKGVEKSGRSFLKDNEFLVDQDQFFAYKQDKKWYANYDYCFIKPSLKEESVIFSNDTYQPLTGHIAINNKYLEDLGLKLGDKVCFRPNSEYEFTIDDEKVYRVRCKNVTIKL